MSTRRSLLLLSIVVLLALAACADSSTSTGSAAATISLGVSQFSGATSVTIRAGQAVKFDDSAGGAHHLVAGTDGKPSSEAGAPSELGSSGLSFSGGDVKIVTFPTAGTYQITCTIHPFMQATVTVTA